MHRTAKYFITFTPKCFVLAVAAVNAKLTAIMLDKLCKILQFLHSFVNSVHDNQFCACWLILRKILCMENRRILISLVLCVHVS